ncbi:PLP-dependent cysteine synthase family protein [Mycobacterium yunnanensis]|uniref:PLP-dependent cysteine synthase family protein n=1 Tax=Mycobacterium yunnanensis TaxID=368477 RepID=UPI0021F2F674|nr:pyridoxal-phosphate dependent enzyme [Mycobacterium yunnanensis]
MVERIVEHAVGIGHGSITDAIGSTPLVRLNAAARGLRAAIFLKLEYLNPGGSIKDRAARAMVLGAEADGLLRPGGTIVEGTSGNTGIGLALIGAARGYRVVTVLPDKTSADKLDFLRALNAEVVVTASNRPVGHPEHVRTLARRIATEIPGGWLADQYDNPANPRAHFDTTGPELWNQTQGSITHLVAGVGTGGTITGTGEYLKAASAGRVRIVAADPASSRYSGGDGRAYYVESVGHYLHPETDEDVWPMSYHPEVVDEFIAVQDREALDTARLVAAGDGIFMGGSGGLAVAAALQLAQRVSPESVIAVIVPDSGRNYLTKYYDESWLARWGFDAKSSSDDVRTGSGKYVGVPVEATIADARAVAEGLPAVPVHIRRSGSTVVAAEIVGSVDLEATGSQDSHAPVRDHLGPVPALAGIGEPVAAIRERAANAGSRIVVLVRDGLAVTTIATNGPFPSDPLPRT